MLRISLLEFIAAGAFGPVRLGLTDEEVRHILGEPDNWTLRSSDPAIPYICKYGDIEFYYEQAGEQLVSIYTDADGIPDGGSRIDLDPWIIRRGIPIEEVEAALNAAGVPFVRRPFAFRPSAMLLVTDSGVEIGFYVVPDEYGPPVGLNFILKSEIFSNKERCAERDAGAKG